MPFDDWFNKFCRDTKGMRNIKLDEKLIAHAAYDAAVTETKLMFSGVLQIARNGVDAQIISRHESHKRLKTIRDVQNTLLIAENKRIKEQSEALSRAVMADIDNTREPLTKAQINEIVNDVFNSRADKQTDPETIVRAIERAHGIGL